MVLETTDSAHTTAEAAKRSPRTHVDSQPLPTDSMVTVSLSESDAGQTTETEEEEDTGISRHPEITIDTRRLSSRPSSLDIICRTASRHSSQDATIRPYSPRELRLSPPPSPSRSRSNSNESNQSAQVDWEELEKTEEHQPKEEGSDDSMALLLARLEQENNAIAHDPKSGLKSRLRSQSRPPSIHQLKRLVENQDGMTVRFSLLPSPPPMTELEFWAALVRDYPQTIQRLPTLTLNKIRGGIPAPLRGVVWQSMAGSRDRLIEDQYETLCGQSSPYENIINKDIGRSFPGVDMFRDPEGEGQKMMGRVLKCFSLYDNKIGYCQGLGFLVGPLLMQMGDKEAFCVLVRLMEDYDLRSCFLPDLSGLHLRIYQFQQLMKQHLPTLSGHLDVLQIEAAYLSQWFLSFFAVTCPLPMLFRIYDVIFAEGASETIMRVALSIMKRNEEKILASSEFEDVMQLLLSRALWDPYGRNAQSADDLVNDFVSFTGVVTRDTLQSLEAGFKAQKDEAGVKPEVQKTATSFLGRLWAPATSSTKSVNLSPNLSAPSRPVSFLRRTPSKQSIASTLNSVEGTSEGTASHASTAPTDISSNSRVSSADVLSLKSTTGSLAPPARMLVSSKDKDLHGQIEELLVHISQMQKDHAAMADELQREREERREDQRVVRTVVNRIKTSHFSSSSQHHHAHKRGASLSQLLSVATGGATSASRTIPADVLTLIDSLDTRFPVDKSHHRQSSAFETKEYLRESLARTKEQLSGEASRTHALQRTLDDRDKDLASAQETLRETRHRLQEAYADKQRLDRVVNELRASARKGSAPWTPDSGSPEGPTPSLTRSDTADTTASSVSVNGLREFRLNRTESVKKQQVFTKRSSSLATQAILTTENHAPADNEALLLELVTAKTAEALARQELEEMRGRMETLRRAMSGGSVGRSGSGGVSPAGSAHKATPSEGGFFGARLATPSHGTTTPGGATAAGGGGGFWGWGKRSVSTPPQ